MYTHTTMFCLCLIVFVWVHLEHAYSGVMVELVSCEVMSNYIQRFVCHRSLKGLFLLLYSFPHISLCIIIDISLSAWSRYCVVFLQCQGKNYYIQFHPVRSIFSTLHLQIKSYKISLLFKLRWERVIDCGCKTKLRSVFVTVHLLKYCT